eukprot:8063837-Alexandrium_andersonii.AAC.1
MMRSIFRLTAGGGRTVSGVAYSEVSDVLFPPWCLRLLDGPPIGREMWRVLGNGLSDGAPVIGTIIRSER